MQEEKESNRSRPTSATSPSTTWLGLASLIVASFMLKQQIQLTPQEGAVLLLAAAFLPMLVLELLVFRSYRNPSAGLDFSRRGGLSLPRIFVKYLGLFGTVLIFVLLYSVLPVYRVTNYFSQFGDIARILWPLFVLGALIYIPWIDGKMREPEDGYFEAGRFFLGNWSSIRWPELRNYARGWLVKGFYLPIMLGLLVNANSFLMRSNLHFSGFREFFSFSFEYLFLIDLCFGAIGYLFTLRLLDSHIRSAEPTLLGWVVALACYTPFQENITDRYFHYEDGFFWGDLFSLNSTAYILWGSLILLLHIPYVWATACFGLRFSNLTNRGIITSGPYRWMKHPAYVSKNLTWWLISVPFISRAGYWAAVSNCLLLLGVNWIYYLRAKTEERHLSADPEYLAYANWIDRHGLFARLCLKK